MRILFIIVVLLTMISIPALAQECGPGCPVCSGSGSSTGALLEPRTVIVNFLSIPNAEEERGVVSFRAGVISWMDIGMGYALDTEKLLWSARFQALAESESSLRPAIIVGTGSVQTGGSDQSLYLQLTKSWELNEIFSARVSAGAASLLPDLDKIYTLAGLTVTITEKWSPFINYDGTNYHPGLMWLPVDWLSISGIYVEAEEPAISIGFRYSL